jgi:hypothetical protein
MGGWEEEPQWQELQCPKKMGGWEEEPQWQELQCPKKMIWMETMELCMRLLLAIVMDGVAWSQ